MLSIKNVIFLFVRSQMADSGPPLGTVLGNLGINAVNFVKILMNLQKIYLLIFYLK